LPLLLDTNCQRLDPAASHHHAAATATATIMTIAIILVICIALACITRLAANRQIAIIITVPTRPWHDVIHSSHVVCLVFGPVVDLQFLVAGLTGKYSQESTHRKVLTGKYSQESTHRKELTGKNSQEMRAVLSLLAAQVLCVVKAAAG
jgi:hypothetical protein